MKSPLRTEDAATASLDPAELSDIALDKLGVYDKMSNAEGQESDRNWTIREMPPAEKALALAAAKRAKEPVRLWVARAIRRAVDAEREAPGQALVLTAPRMIEGFAPTCIEDVSRAVDTMLRIAEARKVRPPSRALLQAQRLLASGLGTKMR